MTETTQKRIRNGKRIFGVALAVWSVLTGILFIVQIWRIYALDDNPYTVENISKHFAEIAIPVWIWVAAMLVGGVFFTFFPDEKEKTIAYIDPRITLRKLQLRAGVVETETLKKQKALRAVVSVVATALCMVAAAVCIVFLTDTDYASQLTNEFFASHTEAEILVLRCLPWIAAAFAVALFAVWLDGKVTKQEISATKAILAENAKKGVKPQEVRTAKPCAAWQKIQAFTGHIWFKRGLQIALGVCAVTLIVVGVCNGGMADVLAKAVKICTQCIGLG